MAIEADGKLICERMINAKVKRANKVSRENKNVLREFLLIWFISPMISKSVAKKLN